MTLLIYVKTDLHTVKAQGAVGKTFVTQDLGQTVKGHDLILELVARQRLLATLLLTLYDGLHLLICETAVAAYHCTCYAGAFYHAGISHLQDH